MDYPNLAFSKFQTLLKIVDYAFSNTLISFSFAVLSTTKQDDKFSNPALLETGMSLALVAAMGGVLLEDVAVATAEFFQD